LSKRAVGLHAAVLFFVPACAAAAWWQITRATDGNGLSYLYAVEWPIFAILGVYFWWMLIHTNYDTVGLRGMRNRGTPDTATPGAAAPAAAPEEALAMASATSETSVPITPSLDQEDPELAAYNARLADLAGRAPQTWRHREHTVVRRGQPS
jgi:hypothetical protein